MDEAAADRFDAGRADGRERVLVAGCGAVGTVFATLLAESGCRVDVLGRGEHLGALGRDGAAVTGIWGEHRARLAAAFDDAGAARGPYDAVLVACKAFQTDELLDRLPASVLAGDGFAVSLQNGLGNVEKLAARFGAGRTLGGRVIFGIEIARPGCACVTVEADATLVGPGFASGPGSGGEGGATDAAREGARRWAARFARAGIPARATDDVLAALWAKVFYNAALNPMGALLGLRYGDLPRDPDRRRVMDRVIEEAWAVAVAEGVRLPWAEVGDYLEHFYGRLLPATVEHRSSMLQDLERGRRTEIDAISGEVCRRGDRHGIDVSANRALLALVRSRSDAAAGPDGRPPGPRR